MLGFTEMELLRTSPCDARSVFVLVVSSFVSEAQVLFIQRNCRVAQPADDEAVWRCPILDVYIRAADQLSLGALISVFADSSKTATGAGGGRPRVQLSRWQFVSSRPPGQCSLPLGREEVIGWPGPERRVTARGNRTASVD